MTSPLHPGSSAPLHLGTSAPVHPSSPAPPHLRSSAPLHILVTGGAGFIGSHLVDALVTRGPRVRVFDNLEPQVHGGLREQENWPAYANPDAEYILGDMRDREALRKAMQDVEVIFHQAAAVGVGQSMYEVERYVDANTRGTAVLLDILANDAPIRDRVRKLIVASSMSIYGEGKYECPVHGVVYPKLRPNDQLAARDWEMRCPIPAASRKSQVAGHKSQVAGRKSHMWSLSDAVAY